MQLVQSMVKIEVEVQAAAIYNQAAVLELMVLKEVVVPLHKRGQTLYTHDISEPEMIE